MPEPAPLCLHHDRVRAEWIDYNGHMNLAYYVLAFDHATDDLLDHLGLDAAYRERTGGTTYVLEIHVTYERELREADPFRVETQLLDHDHKRLHYLHSMYHEAEGFLAATNEVLLMHVDGRAVRSVPFPAAAVARIEALAAAHARLPRPPQAGRVIGIRRPAAGAGRAARPAGGAGR